MLAGDLLDSLPAALWDLAGLASLDLGGNHLRRVDAGVGRLKDLLFLSLHRNALADLPAEVFALEQLETLILSRNHLESLPGLLRALRPETRVRLPAASRLRHARVTTLREGPGASSSGWIFRFPPPATRPDAPLPAIESLRVLGL